MAWTENSWHEQSAIEERVRRRCAFWSYLPVERRRPRELSGGQRQRGNGARDRPRAGGSLYSTNRSLTSTPLRADAFRVTTPASSPLRTTLALCATHDQ